MLSCTQTKEELRPGVIDGNSSWSPGVYTLPAPANFDTSVITISGDDLVLDFEGIVLDGDSLDTSPDNFTGIGVRVLNCRKVTIRNLTIRGYKIGFYAENVDSLVLENCDFSYNFRQRLESKWDRESLGDWLYYHDNENDDWFRYGAAAYLKNCQAAVVRGLRVTQGQNGLMLVGCNDGLFYNNDIRFNSGLGIGMYRSSRNRIMHNKLDWNVRGYSHGQYARGQDSAGILLYEQCSENTIAFNSATHSGDGLFLWAGNTTMDTGQGGCNDNVIYKNDFSHSVANGVEATFSSNIIVDNILNDSRYGVWAGYSHHTYIAGNTIDGCEFGVAIEHGNHNQVRDNLISNCDVGVQLWERSAQPAGWGYSEARDVSSRVYQISHNAFSSVKTALEISGTDRLVIGDNSYEEVEEQLDARAPNDYLEYGPGTITSPPGFELPEPLPDGIDALLPDGALRGRQYIMVNAWGPYDFNYPHAQLRTIAESQRNFSLFGPTGNWEVRTLRGLESINPLRGSLPGALLTTIDPDSATISVDLVFIGQEFVDQFGDTIRRGTPSHFGYAQYSPQADWNVTFYAYDDSSSPLGDNSIFDQLQNFSPAGQLQTPTLGYRWWREPMEGVPPDKFATVAQTQLNCVRGEYLIETESDDGIRVYVDGSLVIDHWDVHTPAMDRVQLSLGGDHEIRILHFDNGGLAALDFSITPISMLPN